MKDSGISLIFALPIFFVVACTQPAVKPIEDIKRIQQIDHFIEEVRQLIQAGDSAGLRAKTSQDQEEAIQKFSKSLDSIEQLKLEFYIDRIVLDQERAVVALHWEFYWREPSVVRPFSRRGNVTVHLKGNRDLSIESITGDNPLVAPLNEKTPLP